MFVRYIDHCAPTIAAQDMDLLALEAAHHHRVMGGDEDLRLPGGGIKGSASKCAAERTGTEIAQYTFDIVEIAQLPDRVPSEEIVSAVRRQLSWTHFKTLIYIDDPLKRDFYLQMCQQEGWSTRTLQDRLDSQLFERTALSKQPEQLLEQELATLRQTGNITPALVLKDPYVLDFLGLQDRYLEKDLEDAILRKLENFLLELGAGFTFVARQKRIQIDNDDFYIDLLLYNRRLKRLVAIELKLGDFKAADKGQMELYLRWLAKYEQEAGEAPPLGIILCSGKKQEQIELLELDASGIHVAEYLTSLPPREVLQAKLHEAIARSRARLENRGEDA